MHKHTPGEWEIDDTDERNPSVYTPSGHGTVFVIARDVGGQVRQGESGKWDDLSEVHANARLIAAAPDLLDAALCAEIKLARYRAAHGDSWIGGVAAEYDATVATLRAAIARATGVSP